MLSNYYNEVKAWFNHSWSILIARLEVLTGFLVGALGAVDWTALTNLDFKDGIYNMNTLIVSILLVVKGVISEIGRRSGTITDKDSTLVPTSVIDKLELKPL